jgi:peroxiredoxin
MSLTPSTMLALGTPAADFFLGDTVTDKKIGLLDFDGLKGLLVTFISKHCPYVQHIKKELAKLGTDYAGKGLGLVAISSNDVANYPDDAPEQLKIMAREEKFNFPILYDESQSVAKAYTAACTPDFFLFDAQRKLIYRGQLDDSRPGNGKPVTGKDLRAAIDALLSARPIAKDQKPSMGCNIKWKPGNAPAYFH